MLNIQQGRLETESGGLDVMHAAAISSAISLKRIADALEKHLPIEEVQPPAIVASYMKANGLICVRRK